MSKVGASLSRTVIRKSRVRPTAQTELCSKKQNACRAHSKMAATALALVLGDIAPVIALATRCPCERFLMCKKHTQGPLDIWYDCAVCCEADDRSNVIDVPLCFLLDELETVDCTFACEVLEEYGKRGICPQLDAACSRLQVQECRKCGSRICVSGG